MKPIRFVKRIQRGFALVVTLSLMILLTVVAVGLLTLSSISLRSSTQGEALQIARSNARLALMLAISQVQSLTGPDQRITINADQQSDSADGSQSSSALGNRHWTGVFRSWPSTSATRPDPEFLSWLISGSPEIVDDVIYPKTAISGNDAVELVGTGTLGEGTDGQVKVPALKLAQKNGKPARLAWWVGDQSTKAALATPPASQDMAMGTVRNNLQAASRNALEFASTGKLKPFAGLAADDVRLPLVTSWQQSEFLASDVSAPRGLFHDVAPYSTGLLTNVSVGGFRKDLSLQLERNAAAAPITALYKVNGENGINLHELWAYYNAYKEVKRSGAFNYTTSGRLDSKTPHLLVDGSPSACALDDEFHLKQPVIISYQMVLSFKIVPVIENGATKNRLHVISDPIITLWNPLDIPVVVPTTSFISVKYWQIPYDILIRVNGAAPVRAPLAASLSKSTASADGDANYLSIQIGKAEQMVFKPGEVIKFSQSGSMIEMSKAGNKNALLAKKGFNHGGGYAIPLRNLSGQVIDLQPGATVTYEAIPNNYTAGKKGTSGNSVSGNNTHTRHFSLTHHEVYVGADRADLGDSLGYGGMYIDWDFGNRRLKPGEVRQMNQVGTKPTSERLYANKFPKIFKPLTPADARPLSFGQLMANKSPFLLLSYDAKTEFGSETGTRSLARFNPKAHHIDFYNLSTPELDMLPYEFRAEPLVSWANRSLDLSSDGSGFFGGGMNAQDGTNMVTTHSFPREPIVSLAAFQHSFANGFEIQKPVRGYATLNGREPMMPHISHAIGNSMAPPMIASDKTDGSLPGGRPMADHSYLANLALWDDWFLSGVAPQQSDTYGKTRDQKTVANEFFSEKSKLPVVRYLPNTDGQDPTKLVNSFFSGTLSNDTGIRNLASHLRVDGMFNVNSSSVEAWKAVLGSLKGRPIVVRSLTGQESISPAGGNVPVVGLSNPQDLITNGSGNIDLKDASQWVGRRELTEEEIDQLAVALVREIRKRGPFLSLADFVNRRVGTSKELARAGAVQSALDSDQVTLNRAFVSGTRAVAEAANRFDFPEGEKGPRSYGIPGIIKQADILTPIAPVLAVRSDSFVIRSYGEAVDANGKITARAWCEAVVERDRNFVDPTDKAETLLTSLGSKVNKDFGRRYKLVSFRWLSPTEV